VGTVPQQLEQLALRVVPVMVVIEVAMTAPTTRPTLQGSGAATAVEGSAEKAVQGRAGRALVRLFLTRLFRWRL